MASVTQHRKRDQGRVHSEARELHIEKLEIEISQLRAKNKTLEEQLAGNRITLQNMKDDVDRARNYSAHVARNHSNLQETCRSLNVTIAGLKRKIRSLMRDTGQSTASS